MDERPFVARRKRLRDRLATISRGLIAYGVTGIVLAVIGLGALFWTGAAIGSLGGRIEGESEQLGATLRATATTLRDASRTAESFGRTLDETPPSVRQAAQTIRNLRPRLEGLEQQAGAINLLGSRPLQGIGELFGQIAADLDGLDGQLDRIADGLGQNRSSLDTNARSLARLGDRLSAFANRLDAGIVTDSLAEIETILFLVLVVLVASMAVPAAGALALGLWLRGELGLGRPARPPLIVVER